MVALLAISFFVLLLFYWAFRPYTVVEHEYNPFKLEQYTYKAGDTLKYRVKFKKFSNNKATIYGSYINGVSLSVPTQEVSLPKGEYEFLSNDKVIPANLGPGEHRYCEVLVYQVNPIREVSHDFCTEPFLIIE